LISIRMSATPTDGAVASVPSRTRNVGLDLLRFVAVFLVLGAHFREVPDVGRSVFRHWQMGGWVGVDLFFVLSGYLVSGLLFDEYDRTGRLDIARFLVRRGWKIYPPFWLLICFTLAIPLVFKQRAPAPLTVSSVSAELLFFQNYVPGLWGHTWSLAVEEHFYIGLAFLFAGLLRLKHSSDPFSALPLLFALVAACCFGFRVLTEWLLRSQPYNWFSYCGTHLRIDSLFFGVLLAYLRRRTDLDQRLSRIPGFTLGVAGTIFLFPAFFIDIGKHHQCWPGLVVLLYVGAGLLILAAVRLKSTDAVFLRLLASLGAASYSIYLWHGAVNIYGTRVVEKVFDYHAAWLYVVIYVLGALAWGWLSHRLCESPILALRDRILPSSRRRPSELHCPSNTK